MTATPIVYKDFWFKIIGSLVASQVIDSIDREESYFERLSSKYFYSDLLGGFVIALILWEIVRFSTRYLDKKYSWIENSFRRTLLQFLLGVCVPALFSFLFTLAFMKLAYDQDIFRSGWLYSEFYTVIIIILFINLVYFTWWLYDNWKRQQEVVLVTSRDNTSASDQTTQWQMKVIEVTRAGKTILLPHREIAFAYLADGYCYIRPFQGEVFVTTYTLDEVARLLREIDFFRVNRQMLVSRRSCSAYKSIENGKIDIELNPPFKTQVIVSQKRAKDFRKWIAAAPMPVS